MLNFKPFFYHRKYWEWVYILHKLVQWGVAGKRGLGFGVGATEPLTAAFVKFGANIMATDAPADVAVQRAGTPIARMRIEWMFYPTKASSTSRCFDGP